MSDFDYGNARLRAMRSRLLSRQALEALTEAGTPEGLITALMDTAYREAVEAAVIRLAGMACLAEALRTDLVRTVGRARQFFSGPAGELAGLALRRYDLHNVKTVLRGLARQVSADEIIANTLPVGELRPADLARLARSANVRGAIDLLATWAMPWSQPLLELRARRRGENADTPEMELALDRWRLRESLKAAREADEAAKPLMETLLGEADAANLLTALRLVGVADPVTLREHFGVDDITALFMGPGAISLDLLVKAARAASIVEAVAILSTTAYQTMLADALEIYTRTNHLSAFEQALTRRQLQHAAGCLTRDPLGVGVLIGYVALKTNEIANLRAIAQGLSLGEKPERIKAELMMAQV